MCVCVCVCARARIFCIVTLETMSTLCVGFFVFIFYFLLLITFSISMYIMCVILRLFSALSRRVGALQIFIIIIIITIIIIIIIIIITVALYNADQGKVCTFPWSCSILSISPAVVHSVFFIACFELPPKCRVSTALFGSYMAACYFPSRFEQHTPPPPPPPPPHSDVS